MAKCNNCKKQIDFALNYNKKSVPVEIGLVNIIYRKGGSKYLTDKGEIMHGETVGDSHEGGYLLGYKIHECEEWYEV